MGKRDTYFPYGILGVKRKRRQRISSAHAPVSFLICILLKRLAADYGVIIIGNTNTASFHNKIKELTGRKVDPSKSKNKNKNT